MAEKLQQRITAEEAIVACRKLRKGRAKAMLLAFVLGEFSFTASKVVDGLNYGRQQREFIYRIDRGYLIVKRLLMPVRLLNTRGVLWLPKDAQKVEDS